FSSTAKCQFKKSRQHPPARFCLQTQFVEQDLIENQLADFAIDLPDAFIQRWDPIFMLFENGISRSAQFSAQHFAVAIGQVIAAMLLKKAPQDIVQQLARIDGLQVESRFAARLEAQHAIAKKSERTIAIGAQTTGAV